jgi:hypothetical protein
MTANAANAANAANVTPVPTPAPTPERDSAAAAPETAAPVGAAAHAAAPAPSATATATATATPAVAAEHTPPGAGAARDGGPHSGYTVNQLADRLDDSRFFSALFDFTFTNYVTRKLAGPVYIVGLVLIGLGIIVGFGNWLSAAIATHSPAGAFVFLFGVLVTVVAAILAVLLLRVGIEVFCAIIEIAQNTRRRPPRG